MTKEAAEEVLELPRRYSKDDLRRAYTGMARRYHPDSAIQNGLDPATAQARMVAANKANHVLKQLFADHPGRVVERGWGGIASGFSEVDWRHSADDVADGADPWDFANDWDATPPAEKPKASLRTVLLGPVVPRLAFVVGFALLWWNTFPLLSHNGARYFPVGPWTLGDAARLVMAIVYPTYLFLYELASGYVSGLARGILNAIISWVTRSYVDLRSHTSSYGCSLYKLLKNQVYAVLLAPVAMWMAAVALEQESLPLKIAIGVPAALLAFDAIAACVHGGFVNVWTSALAERIEARYLMMRKRLLQRCGAWEGWH